MLLAPPHVASGLSRVGQRIACACKDRWPPVRNAAFIAYCAIHPINPQCCPAPCPIVDSAKIAEFSREVGEAWQSVEGYRQIADRSLSLVLAFGPSGPLGSGLRRVPGPVSSVFKTVAADAPAMLTAADPANPRAVAEILKTALFEPDGLAASSLSASVDHLRMRAALSADEAANALASGLHGFRRLIDVSADGGRSISAAAGARDVRSDMAVNLSARQALLDNLGGLKELLVSWAAAEGTASAVSHPSTLGPLPSTSAAAGNSAVAQSLQAETERIDRLRNIRLLLDQLDATVSDLASLHNERHAVVVMQAQYPGLWNTIASDNQAIQFRAADAASAVASLAQLFVDGRAAFQAAQAKLTALDTTGWKDNATKNQAAAAAAQGVIQQIAARPQDFGVLRDDRAALNGDPGADEAFARRLAGNFAAWLEDDKLERFWAPLRADAVAAMAGLDQRIKDINARRGFDLAGGPAAADREKALLARYDQQAAQIQSADRQSLDDGQKTLLAAYGAAFRTAASAVRSDPGAANFVIVAWP